MTGLRLEEEAVVEDRGRLARVGGGGEDAALVASACGLWALDGAVEVAGASGLRGAGRKSWWTRAGFAPLPSRCAYSLSRS